MTFRTRISAAVERRRSRKEEARKAADRVKQKREENQERTDRAYALTPQELARRITEGELVDPQVTSWARHVPARDLSNVAQAIAKLSERDRQLIALIADGWTRREIASWWFQDPQRINQDMRRVFERLGAEE